MKKAGIFLIAVLFLTGCGSIELTERESDMITSYAAASVLKYDVNYQKKLELEQEKKEEKKSEGNKEETKKDETKNSSQKPNDNTAQQPVDIKTANSIQEALKLEGISFQYQGYEVTDFYPNNKDNLDFVMYAEKNAELIVLKFQITNTLSEDKHINMLSMSTNLQAVFNGNKKADAQRTAFPNDLYNLSGKLQPNETKDIIIVFEVSKDFGNTVASAELIVKKDGENQKISLQ